MSQIKVNSIIPVAGVPTGGGGGIIQVITNSTRDSTGSVSISNNRSYVAVPNQNVTITPTSSTSKILISFQQLGEFSFSGHMADFIVERAISGGATTNITGNLGSNTNASSVFTQSMNTYHGDDNDTTIEIAHCSNYLDSPATTSAVTYTMKVRQNEGGSGTYYYNRTVRCDNNNHSEYGLSWITVMEVSA